jgi:hypothetical protein
LVNVVGHGCPTLYSPHKLVLEQKVSWASCLCAREDALIILQILKLMDVQDSVSSRYAPDNGNGETFRFNFPLAKEPWITPICSDEDEDGVARKYIRTLPSSLSVFGPWCPAAAGQACCQAEAIVRYEIEATAFRGDDIISKFAQEVRIYDSPDSHPPPVHTADFPGEYHCAQEKRLKRFQIPGPRLTIIASEPKPLEVRPSGDCAMAAFALKFIMRDTASPPRQLDIRVNSLLKAVTFISASKMDSHPTILQSHASPFLAAVPKFGRSYHRSLRVCHWMRYSENDWIAHALVWLPITENATPAPTFFTPYLSRRYSVSLRLEVKGEGKGLFNLNVPLQIVYPMEVGSADAPSYEVAITPPNEEEGCQEEDRLPVYVR